MGIAVSTPPITIDQYLSFESPEGFYDELINGRIVLSPDPKPLHQDIAENIYILLRSAIGAKYKVGQRTNLRFPSSNSMPSPDVFVIRREEWNRARGENEYPDGSKALLVLEVISSGNRSRKLRDKAELYRNNSVEHWLVYPKRKELKVFRSDSVLRFSASDAGAIVLPSALNGGSILIADIFKL